MTTLTDANGVLKDSSRFKPFGGYRNAPLDAGLTDLGFTGHKENRDIGLTYMNARYYVSSIGRFASADTMVPNPFDSQHLNRYSYVSNNPINLIDPSGHCGQSTSQEDQDCNEQYDTEFRCHESRDSCIDEGDAEISRGDWEYRDNEGEVDIMFGLHNKYGFSWSEINTNRYAYEQNTQGDTPITECSDWDCTLGYEQASINGQFICFAGADGKCGANRSTTIYVAWAVDSTTGCQCSEPQYVPADPTNTSNTRRGRMIMGTTTSLSDFMGAVKEARTYANARDGSYATATTLAIPCAAGVVPACIAAMVALTAGAGSDLINVSKEDKAYEIFNNTYNNTNSPGSRNASCRGQDFRWHCY